jgi:hypothetical protein
VKCLLSDVWPIAKKSTSFQANKVCWRDYAIAFRLRVQIPYTENSPHMELLREECGIEPRLLLEY